MKKNLIKIILFCLLQSKYSKLIKSLNKKVNNQLILLIKGFINFIHFRNLEIFHTEINSKINLEYKYLPLNSCAIYVPGSTASYPSSVLMNAIPAIVAKVKRIVMINPAYKGKQNPAVLYAARKCGIKEIYSIGGPSVLLQLAYGTKKIKKVDKIVGPGNAFVAAAKR